MVASMGRVAVDPTSPLPGIRLAVRGKRVMLEDYGTKSAQKSVQRRWRELGRGIQPAQIAEPSNVHGRRPAPEPSIDPTGEPHPRSLIAEAEV